MNNWVDHALGDGDPKRGLEILTDVLDISEADFGDLVGVSERTMRRWFHSDAPLPRKVCCVLDAWRRCKEAGLPNG